MDESSLVAQVEEKTGRVFTKTPLFNGYGYDVDNNNRIVRISLTSLNVEIFEEIVSILPDFLYLKELSLTRCEIADVSLLGKLKNLSILNLERNRIQNIEALKYLTNLENLNLAENQITDIRALEHLTKLSELDLYNNKI